MKKKAVSRIHFVVLTVVVIVVLTVDDKKEKFYNSCRHCMLKVNIRNNRKRSKIRLKLTIKAPEPRQWHCSMVFFVNFEHISHLLLELLLILKM